MGPYYKQRFIEARNVYNLLGVPFYCDIFHLSNLQGID